MQHFARLRFYVHDAVRAMGLADAARGDVHHQRGIIAREQGVAAAAQPADGLAAIFGQLAQRGQVCAVGKLNIMRGSGGQREGGAVNQRVVVLESEHGFRLPEIKRAHYSGLWAGIGFRLPYKPSNLTSVHHFPYSSIAASLPADTAQPAESSPCFHVQVFAPHYSPKPMPSSNQAHG